MLYKCHQTLLREKSFRKWSLEWGSWICGSKCSAGPKAGNELNYHIDDVGPELVPLAELDSIAVTLQPFKFIRTILLMKKWLSIKCSQWTECWPESSASILSEKGFGLQRHEKNSRHLENITKDHSNQVEQ